MKTMKAKRLVALALTLFIYSIVFGQQADFSKMSPMVKRIVMTNQRLHPSQGKSVAPSRSQLLTAFVKTDGGDTSILRDNGCNVLAQFGDICIASIPTNRLGTLSVSPKVTRIEAGNRCTALMDSTALHINALPAYEGTGLPQAFTGKGVVMGIQDIGFDLTHPNFYSKDLSEYRIKAFWDQLSTDTVGSSFYVGRDYVGRDALLSLCHSRDGLIQTHGTHTLGIAAGSGYDSPYRGMAYESDICLVANATSEDIELIDDADLYKYTSATDALGFKYIFDYAASQGKPCVISFSEGSHQDMKGDDELYYAVLDSLVGQGRILVASAGNDGDFNTYFHKPQGVESMGGFLTSSSTYAASRMRSTDFFDIRLVVYGNQNDTIMIPSRWAYEAADSQYVDTLNLSNGFQLYVSMAGYPSCYGQQEQAYEFAVETPWQSLGIFTPVSFEVIGADADIEWYRSAGYITKGSLNPSLTAGEHTHSINSPGSAPSVICVGANSYRTSFTNYKGTKRVYDQGTNGIRGEYSSVGPTVDGRRKPDVLAPGTNIISSYNSYYLENNPDASDIYSDVTHFDFNGRTYSWTANSGTSMSTPAVGGAIALWLEANPQLTPADCMDILSRTCRHPDETLSYPNNLYGHGEIDVYQGLLEALNLPASIPTLSRHQPSGIRFALNDETLTVSLNTSNTRPLNVCIYSTSGQRLKSITLPASSDSHTLSLHDLPKGVLAIQVIGEDAGMTGSTLIRH